VGDDLSGLREATGIMLAPDFLAVYHDVEDATGPFDEFGAHPDLLLDCIRQTGGIGVVVSLAAIGDSDGHVVDPF
jgi:hypothetical protein